MFSSCEESPQEVLWADENEVRESRDRARTVERKKQLACGSTEGAVPADRRNCQVKQELLLLAPLWIL